MDAKLILHNTRGYSDLNANLIRNLLDEPALGEYGVARYRDHAREPFIVELRYTQTPWPVIIDRRMLDEFRLISRDLLPVIYRAVTSHFGRDADAFHEYVGWPSEIYRYMIANPLDTDDFILRYDGLYSDGTFRIVEINVGTTCGGWYTDWLTDVYRDCLSRAGMPIDTLRFRPVQRQRFGHIIDRIRKLPKPSLTGNLLYLMDPMESQDNLMSCLQGLYSELCPPEFTEGHVFWTDNPDEVEYSSGGDIRFRGHVIDGVFAKKQLPDLPEALLAKLSIAQTRKKILFPDTPAHHMFGSKILLALFFEWIGSGQASQADAALIRKYFPWTVRLRDQVVEWRGQRVNLRDLLRANKDDFVLKLSNSAQGDAVFVGRFQTPERWETLLHEKFAEPYWLVQEYCAPDKLVICDQHSRLSVGEHVWGIAANGPCYGGSFVRGLSGAATDGVVNSARGAFLAVTVETDD